MKKLQILLLMSILTICFACEKAIIDDDEQENRTEITKDDSKKSDSNGEDDNDDNEDDEDWKEDTSQDDKDSSYEETDFVDGNQKDDDEGTGGKKGKIEVGDTINVWDFLTKELPGGVYVKGYIVGACTQRKDNNDFTAPFKWSSALLMADNPDEKNLDRMMAVELKSGSKIRKQINLVDHPEYYKHKLLLFGYHSSYMGGGMKNIGSGFWLDW